MPTSPHPWRSFGQPEFANGLKGLGYKMVDGSRLSRATEHGEAFIDLIAPAPASRAPHNQPAGRFRVDKFPGVRYGAVAQKHLRGAPSEVESLITVPLEPTLNGVPNVDVIRSKSVEQLSSIEMIFEPGTDLLRVPGVANVPIWGERRLAGSAMRGLLDRREKMKVFEPNRPVVSTKGPHRGTPPWRLSRVFAHL
jgi:hypothetical protein